MIRIFILKCFFVYLKLIDALDTWEDITELGYHLINLDIELSYGKILIYSMILKCLDPILIVVATLSSYTDICNYTLKRLFALSNKIYDIISSTIK